MKNHDIPELLTPKEVAEIVKTTTGSLANLRCRGDGPPVTKFGGKVYYPRKKLIEYIEARTIVPGNK